MSRVGNKIIPLPTSVKVKVNGSINVEGPKGKLSVPLPEGISLEEKDGSLSLKRASEKHAAKHGLTRALLANAIQGVSDGFVRELDIVGVGYRAEAKGKVIIFSLGYSHPIEFLLPDGVEVKIEKGTHITLTGYDRQVLGQIAANIRMLRPPEPYKQKGIRYTGEYVPKKEGKSGATK
jgi:large subunit ribosomal protein L6